MRNSILHAQDNTCPHVHVITKYSAISSTLKAIAMHLN